MLSEAQRRFHNFFGQLPEEKDRLSWFALLRHHGVPTRLLDVTHSLFIASYFAVRNSKPDTDAAIWIFSRNQIERAFSYWEVGFDASQFKSPFTNAIHNEEYYWPFPKNIKIDYEIPNTDSIRTKDSTHLNFISTLDAAMRGYVSKPGVAIIEPSWLSRRIDFQQGAFLVPFNVRMSFEENLYPYLSFSEAEREETTLPDVRVFIDSWFKTKIIKVRIPINLHAQLKKN
ncbi:MAG: FRG domain-containing protein [Nitrosomonas sp.]